VPAPDGEQIPWLPVRRARPHERRVRHPHPRRTRGRGGPGLRPDVPGARAGRVRRTRAQRPGLRRLRQALGVPGRRAAPARLGGRPRPRSTSGSATVGLDAARSALWGGSYGGYMVLAGCRDAGPTGGRPGVDIVGISSLVTFLENTSDYRRAIRASASTARSTDDREFLVSASPITYLDDIVAPLFVIHGANDPRVPLLGGRADQGRSRREGRALRDEGLPRRGTRSRQAGQPPGTPTRPP
jgi:hypothetical protein